MALARFQDFLSGLLKGQRLLFSGGEHSSIDELLNKLMGTLGEVSGIVTARQVLDHYAKLSEKEKLGFFQKLEQSFNADQTAIKGAYLAYEANPSSATLSLLSRAAAPLRLKLLRRLNQTPGATHDLVAMRTDLLKLLREYPALKPVDDDFLQLFKSWFGRGFLTLQTINWSTSAAILERIIRYEAVHAIKDWEDLRSRIEPPNRRCFAFFHPALVDEPLIFVEVALLNKVPDSIDSILNNGSSDKGHSSNEPNETYTTAAFYSISNCQPGLGNVSFGNFLIKQVVEELRSEFPGMKTFVTLSPIPGFSRWLEAETKDGSDELRAMKDEIRKLERSAANADRHRELIKKCVFNYLMQAKRGLHPLDPVARFHLGNGASILQMHSCADLSDRGLQQSFGTMVNYHYELRKIEQYHEQYTVEGNIEFNDKLKPLLLKA